MEFNSIKRFGSYGTARQNAKERIADLEPDQQYYIFKDITNGPFTSFKTDAYVLAVGPKREETEEDEDE